VDQAAVADTAAVAVVAAAVIATEQRILNQTAAGGINLPKEDSIEVLGKVVEKFKAGMFSIELDAGKTVLATMAGRLRRNRIKIMNGDRVSLELSPYDLTRGRITYRHK
jgi:translation initiation factor IF-1